MQPVIVRHAHTPTPCPAAIDPLLWRVYQARGITEASELERGLETLLPPSRLDGVDAAVRLIADTLEQGGRILIVGDFDADGATSCALAVHALKAMGHQAVDFLVPNRFEFGYGLTPEIVTVAGHYSPDLLITVDNGVSSITGVRAAKARGWKVLVTDHHLAGDVLPEADVLVNPNLPGCDFPSKALAGVGVIFYVLVALRSRLREIGWFDKAQRAVPNMADYLDLVALGTVADVVPLDRNNRVMVYQGLARIRRGRSRPGITALLRIAGRDPGQAQAADMGFFVGPRLNAAGRLEDMSLGIRCLLCESDDEAMSIAGELDRLNQARRRIENEMKQQAEAMLQDWAMDEDAHLPWGLCLHQPDWHQGVIGILASRIKDKLHRPVIIFADGPDGELKGSARSIRGLHIRDTLDEVAVRQPGLLRKFGGHAMAAGLSLRRVDLDRFATAFDSAVRARLRPSDLSAEIRSDGELSVEAMTLQTAERIADGGPWGQGFEEPVFDGAFDVVDGRVVGEKHWKLRLRPTGGAGILDAIAFNAVESFPALPSRIHAAYRLDRNEWQGRVGVQLQVIAVVEPPPTAEAHGIAHDMGVKGQKK